MFWLCPGSVFQTLIWERGDVLRFEGKVLPLKAQSPVDFWKLTPNWGDGTKYIFRTLESCPVGH